MNVTKSRVNGERLANRTLLWLLCGVSIWRTAVSRILPLCGVSVWWVVLGCLLPGFATMGLLLLVMRVTHASTLAEAMRAVLGRAGAWAAAIILAALLLIEGISSMTALMTMFTQGIGTRGTRFTMAVLTGLFLLCCLHREGLPRAAHFLRWGMGAAAVLTAVFLLGDARADHLFPLYGDGREAASFAMIKGLSLGWPVVLLLTVQPVKHTGRIRDGIIPAGCAVGAVLLTVLSIPQEILTEVTSLADALLLPVHHAPNALRVIGQCLLMLGFLLAICASVQLAAQCITTPLAHVPGWLPYGLVAGLILTQTVDAAVLNTWLEYISPWLLAPLVGLAVITLFAALLRRKR